MIISILNQKGGTGKTTLAVNIVREYHLRKYRSLLVDSDSQGSALRWHELSEGELIDLTCLPVTTMDKDILKFTDSYHRIIIDGIPSMCRLTACAVKAADLVLIPVQPSPYDIWATEDLVRLVKERIEMTEGKLKVAFVVTRKIKGTNIGKEIYSQLSEHGFPIFTSGTTQLVTYPVSASRGLTVMEDEHKGSENAAKEIRSIVDEIEVFANGSN